jgi:[Skp1-protein]-hydroxyproline N-acetylglucosaminyltransferase
MKEETIFISIASYRDKLCNKTIKDIYNKAHKPNNIFIGICQQNKEDVDTDCLHDINNPNISIIRIPHFNAKGPTYARYLCSTLYNGEQYYLQIDSHTIFIKNWDKICINMIKELKKISSKPVLSYYPKEIKDYVINDTGENMYMVPRICKAYFNKQNIISFLGSSIMNTNNEYYKVPYIAAGFIFSEASFLNEIPYDPTLDYLFTGEEILLSVRFFTHGWDIYTPKINIIFHEYLRSDEPKFWTDIKTYSDKNAINKINYYLKFGKQENVFINDKYGLGTIRTLDDFYNYTGINIDDKKVHTNFCIDGNLATNEDIINSYENRWIKEKFEISNHHFTNNKNNKKCILIIVLIFLLYDVIQKIIIKMRY